MLGSCHPQCRSPRRSGMHRRTSRAKCRCDTWPGARRCVRRRPVELDVVPVRKILVRQLGIVAHLVVGVAEILVGEEEPGLVLFDRTAERKRQVGELVSAEPDISVARQPSSVGRDVVVGQRVALVPDVGRPFERVGSGLGHDIHGSARHVAVLGRGADRQHLDLFDGIGVGPPESLAALIKGVVRAVDAPGVRRGARAERRQLPGFVRLLLDHARRDRHHVPEVASGREVLDEFGVEVGADSGAGRVEHRRGRDLDRLLDRRQSHHEIECHERADAHPDILDHLFLETLEHCIDGVDLDVQRGQSEGAPIASDHRTGGSPAHAGRGHRYARQGACRPRL